jgi:hypothetical protein
VPEEAQRTKLKAVRTAATLIARLKFIGKKLR